MLQYQYTVTDVKKRQAQRYTWYIAHGTCYGVNTDENVAQTKEFRIATSISRYGNNKLAWPLRNLR